MKRYSFSITLATSPPQRVSKAADAIKDFAENKQLILLTCHPTHANLLDGNQIELSV